MNWSFKTNYTKIYKTILKYTQSLRSEKYRDCFDGLLFNLINKEYWQKEGICNTWDSALQYMNETLAHDICLILK